MTTPQEGWEKEYRRLFVPDCGNDEVCSRHWEAHIDFIRQELANARREERESDSKFRVETTFSEQSKECTCDFGEDTSREIGHFKGCPRYGEKTWWQEKDIATQEGWKQVFRTLYDDNEAGGSSRWLVSPTTAQTMVEGFIEQARREALETFPNPSYSQAEVDRVVAIARRERDAEVREIVSEARSDSAPFNQEQLIFANNLIEQKNEILDSLLSLLTPKSTTNDIQP